MHTYIKPQDREKNNKKAIKLSKETFVKKVRRNFETIHTPLPRKNFDILHNINHPLLYTIKNIIIPRSPQRPQHRMPHQKEATPSLLTSSRITNTSEEGQNIRRHNHHQPQPLKNLVPNLVSHTTMKEQVVRRFRIMITPNTITSGIMKEHSSPSKIILRGETIIE
jgi:hypothetical protein